MNLRRRTSSAALALLSLVLGLATVLGSTLGSTASAGSEDYRPTYHYSPQRNFMNDPNGLVHYRGVWHMFYQYNPSGSRAGNGSWGHATSTDLVHWTQQPLAISTDADEDVWSGSVVVDKHNTSGFGTRANPPLVAAYTSFHKADGIQRQSLAYSLDAGRTWTKYAGNPVIDIGSKDFRDPKVFWDEARGRWVMVVSLAAEKKVSIYSSPDLRHWTHRSDFGPAGAASAVWECPDLFPIKDKGRTRWVMTVSVSGKMQYFVGDFDGTRFTSPDATYTPPAPTRVLSDFEGTSYDAGWTTTGTAFGNGPSADGPDVTGRHGEKVVDSYGGSDAAEGTLTSPSFTVDQPYLNFLIGGGHHPYVPGGSDAPPPGDVVADFEGPTYGEGWTATGDFVGTGPSASDLPGKVGQKVLDTCQAGCDAATGTISSPEFTLTHDWLNLLVAGGDHPLSGDRPTAVSLEVGGQVVASTQGKNSAQLDWVAWDVSGWKGQQARLVVTDQRTDDWGHVMIDHVVQSDQAAKPWNIATAANLLVDGQVVRTATGGNGPGLDWASWDLRDLQGKRAQVQLVDSASTDWGHLLADWFTLSTAPAQSAADRVRWIDHGNDYYAAVSWNDAPGDKRYMVGWMSNWDYAQDTPTGDWRGQMSVVRELGLRTVDGRPTLVQTPVPTGSISTGSIPVSPRTVTGIEPVPATGRSYRLDVTLTPQGAQQFGVDVRVGGDQRTRVGYDATTHRLFVDRTRSGESGFSGAFPGVHSAPLDLNGQPLRLTVYVDSSSIEVFTADGLVSVSDLVYPDAASDGIGVFAEGGSAHLDRMEVTTLGPAVSR